MAKRRITARDVPIQDIHSILQLLKDMDDSGKKEDAFFGVFEGPFFSSAVYRCAIRIGFDDESR